MFILHARWSVSLAFILAPQIQPLEKRFGVFARGLGCIRADCALLCAAGVRVLSGFAVLYLLCPAPVDILTDYVGPRSCSSS